ncbi:hypothetical protein JCM17961_39000 [Endothiovibrio diazotrophicus]
MTKRSRQGVQITPNQQVSGEIYPSAHHLANPARTDQSAAEYEGFSPQTRHHTLIFRPQAEKSADDEIDGDGENQQAEDDDDGEVAFERQHGRFPLFIAGFQPKP